MSTSTEIKSKISRSIKKTIAPLQQDVKKIANPDTVDSILAASSIPMAMAAKSNIAKYVKSAEMIEAIKVFKGKPNYSVTIGVDYSYYNYFVMRFIEYGTVRVNTPNRKGGIRITIDRTPFLRPAFEAYRKSVFENIQKNVIKHIEANLKRQLKQ